MRQVKLESFEGDTLATEQPDEGFAKGFADGHAAGLADARATQATLAHELVQNIADLEFKYEEARSEITHAMQPLFKALAYKIFPECLSSSFIDQIVTVFLNAAEESAGRQFTLRIHSQHQKAIAEALATAQIDAIVVTDNTLQPHTAWVQHEAGAQYIDCDQLLNDIRAILSTVDFIQPRSKAHGKPHRAE